MAKAFNRYDAPAMLALLQEAGVTRALRARGFLGPDLLVDDNAGARVEIRLFGWKHGRRHLLLEAALCETTMSFGLPGDEPTEDATLLLVQWIREQDPTLDFSSQHPRLPLQEYPGLGVLRRVFEVALRMARDLSKDGVANYPKYPHDAAIFYRSRFFLFADPAEQGRFEALLRALAGASLRDVTLAVIGGCVRDPAGEPVAWRPGLQVFPISRRLADYFHSREYARETEQAARTQYRTDSAALAGTRQVFESSATI